LPQGIFAKELKLILLDTDLHPLLIAALLRLPKMWKHHKCSPMDKVIRKM
jgi:hypothetical protein